MKCEFDFSVVAMGDRDPGPDRVPVNHFRARLPIDGRLATGDGADRQGRLNSGRCVG